MKIEEAIVKIDNFFNPELLKLILLFRFKNTKNTSHTRISCLAH